MGKFFDALKKSEAIKKTRSPESAPKKVVKMSPQTIDELRLDTTAPQEPDVDADQPKAMVQLQGQPSRLLEPLGVSGRLRDQHARRCDRQRPPDHRKLQG